MADGPLLGNSASSRRDFSPNISYVPVPQIDSETGNHRQPGAGTSNAGHAYAPVSDNCDLCNDHSTKNLEHKQAEADTISATIAAGRAVQLLMLRETSGTYEVARNSVYGIALAMPQIARCTNWSRTFTGLAIRSYVNLLVNLAIQTVILYEIDCELNVMNYYGGQMHLCEFGRNFDACPDAQDCIGPNGSQYSPARLYANYQTWSTRMFVQSSLISIFPDRREEIQSNVDPGEYGLESTICRCACLFLFVLTIVNDLRESLGLVTMLWNIPSQGPKTMGWLSYDPPRWTSDKSHAKQMFGHSEMDYIHFSVAGMPVCWKFVNFMIIIVPKIGLWVLLATAGTQFLMETAGICDLIVNCLAMTFILDVDELVADRLCTEATKAIMAKLEGWDQFDAGPLEEMHDHEVISEFTKNETQYRLTDFKLLLLLTPKRLLTTLVITVCLYLAYFQRFCIKTDDGSYISEPLYPPRQGTLGSWNLLRWFIAPYTIPREGDPYWAWPSSAGSDR
eukprot:gnl/MRDRNA2_/MRDRNA2_18011_c0_seq1.p1 gnl/MRDRNA2_/MRDRNA2_18011_c0~~gnl/MRDRNA2_/MRDRNA2_18011_c0_seq1.p1  ORF type:complete len:507 (+),score=62.11 gnl/MRDRNA2_/MRDRNA2_18011_c0_seq1:50-1570(+)